MGAKKFEFSRGLRQTIQHDMGKGRKGLPWKNFFTFLETNGSNVWGGTFERWNDPEIPR